MKDMNNIPGYEKMYGIEFLYIQGEPSSNFKKVTSNFDKVRFHTYAVEAAFDFLWKEVEKIFQRISYI